MMAVLDSHAQKSRVKCLGDLDVRDWTDKLLSTALD